MHRSKGINKVVSEPSEFSVYQKFTGSLIPYFSDRDLVVHCKWTDGKNAEKKTTATLEIFSVEHAARPPVDGVVRANCSKLVWTLTAESKESTLVDVTANIDPEGWSTELMASMWCASWVSRALDALEHHCLVEAGTKPAKPRSRAGRAYDYVAASRHRRHGAGVHMRPHIG